MSEKEGTTGLLPLSTSAHSQAKPSRLRNALVWLCLDEGKDYCPQSDILTPKKNSKVWDNLTEIIGTAPFKTRAVDWLSSAIQVPTESYDDLAPVGEDSRWEKFSGFHDYLLGAFPKSHATLELTKVNTYGLLYIWKGSDTSLKPILLMAHQDVVPVNPSTWDSWKHPPYSGHFDGEKIWGRGSSDDKSGLIGVLSAIELLIENNFQPTRTVVIAFGFDEEISGTQGARTLSTALETRFGKDAFAFIIDEGSGFAEQYGSVFATVGIAEKGTLNAKIEVTTPGGHSSVPPPHTSIGILSSLLALYEKLPFITPLRREDPLYSTLLCYAEHAESLSPRLRWLIKLSIHSNKALLLLEKYVYKNRVWKSQVGTTQAIDIIHGGVKSNALPEKVYAIVNHRISVLSTVAATQEYDTRRAKIIAAHHNLTFNAFGNSTKEEATSSSGTLTLSDAYAYIPGLEPAPVTSTDAAPYQLLSGTIKATFNSHRGLHGSKNIYTAPGMMTGNTDTRHFWNLSKHIFRYNHHNGGNSTSAVANNIHTVNEYILADDLLEMIRFFATLILNSDESTSL
ncbi:carboxypeptidase S [Amanita muscaria]